MDALAEYLLACAFADRLLHVERDAYMHACMQEERLLSRSRWWRRLMYNWTQSTDSMNLCLRVDLI